MDNREFDYDNWWRRDPVWVPSENVATKDEFTYCLNDDSYEWLSSQVERWSWVKEDRPGFLGFCFLRENDALAFKMRWG